MTALRRARATLRRGDKELVPCLVGRPCRRMAAPAAATWPCSSPLCRPWTAENGPQATAMGSDGCCGFSNSAGFGSKSAGMSVTLTKRLQLGQLAMSSPAASSSRVIWKRSPARAMTVYSAAESWWSGRLCSEVTTKWGSRCGVTFCPRTECSGKSSSRRLHPHRKGTRKRMRRSARPTSCPRASPPRTALPSCGRGCRNGNDQLPDAAGRWTHGRVRAE